MCFTDKNHVVKMLFRINKLRVSIRDIALYLQIPEDTILHKIKNDFVRDEELKAITNFLDEYEKQSKVKVG